MRGKMVDLSLQTLDLRITPAYARKSRTSAPALPGYRDHPRIRGENIWVSSSWLAIRGSPPHTRGKLAKHKLRVGGFGLYQTPVVILGLGITPAYAGKITMWAQALLSVWDHPRIRGENLQEESLVPADLGSPPHTRGK